MPSLFSHQHPIEKIRIKSQDLVAAVNKLLRIRDQIGRSPIMYACIESLNDRKRNLHTSVGIEDRPEAARELAKKGYNSGGETQFLASLLQVDAPDAEARMKRALQLILRSGQGDKTSD